SDGDGAAPAVLSQDATVTYGQLREQVEQMAQVLLRRGHAKGERIGLWGENSAFFVAAYLGIIRAGLVAVPLQTELPSEALARIASESGMSGLLVSKRFFARSRAWTAIAEVPVLTEGDLANCSLTESSPMPEID